MEALDARLEDISKRLDQSNGNVRRHDGWIAGREPICEQSLSNLKALADAVTAITTLLAEERGEKKAKSHMAALVNAAVITATAVGSAWAAVHLALATVRP